jgi:hypothetical protein
MVDGNQVLADIRRREAAEAARRGQAMAYGNATRVQPDGGRSPVAALARSSGSNFNRRTASDKTAQIIGRGGAPEQALSFAAAAGGGALGYHILTHLYRNRAIKKLERELDKSRQEFLEYTVKKSAMATVLDDAFPRLKEAAADRRSRYGVVDTALSIPILAALLGAGATAYFTKRVMGQLDRAGIPETDEYPHVPRVIFKTVPGGRPPGPGEKMASESDLETILAGLYLTTDSIGPR